MDPVIIFPLKKRLFLRGITVFEVNEKDIKLVGNDDLNDIETFKRTPKADLELSLNDDRKVRIEVQSGFQGMNDIKQHKISEAEKAKEYGFLSVMVHFDLFNGQVAFVRADNIDLKDEHWITRPQLEGQLVFNMDQNDFIWKLAELPPKFSDFLDF